MQQPSKRKCSENTGPEDSTLHNSQDSSRLKIPSLAHLNTLVKKEIEKSSWWELYGFDIAITGAAIAVLPFGYLLLGQGSTLLFIIGFFIIGYIHSLLTVKVAHAAVHNAFMGSSPFWNKIISVFCIEFWGGLTERGAQETHIKYHHPYTNVISLGDSSSWKVPVLDRYTYLFFAPILLPLIYPLVTIDLLGKRWLDIARVFFLSMMGYCLQLWLFLNLSGLSFGAALLCVIFVRSVYAIPYIHVNVFQHIGLPMYDPNKKPSNRLLQMATSVLNLPRNPFLDYNFGHSIVSCHVEHHLFPRLSDNMCLKVKPLVSQYLKSHGLPYNEDTYQSRLKMFFNQYEELMVQAPPITELVGIQ
ncbi:fatty acid desaturase 6-like [Actinia tenebrosa]|uniref:Fatty acid desaturase 6-like n=1 Tax=Actinia tenebrosa TaxID=6105 RepID=A0A6P8I8M8_ACTTE|nr:fatty acid desaturase 6-like [Actinia tenebrosa]